MFNVYMTSETMKLLPLLCLCLLTRSGTTFAAEHGGTVKDRLGEIIAGFPTGWVVAVVLGVIGIVLLGTVVRTLRQSYRRNSQTGPPKDPSTGLDVTVKLSALDVVAVNIVLVFDVVVQIPFRQFRSGIYTLWVVSAVLEVIGIVLLCTVATTLHQSYRQNSQTGFLTGWVVAVVLEVIGIVLLGTVVRTLRQSYRRNSQTGSPTALALAVLCTVVVVVLALYLVWKWAPHLRGEGNTIQPPHSTQNLLSTSVVLEPHTNGQRTNSNAMTENVRPNQNGEESPEEASNSSVSGEDEQVKGQVSHGPDELTELKHGPHDDLLY